jgi:hypothetical protein
MLIKIEHLDGEAWMESDDVGVIVRSGGKLKVFARNQPSMTWEMETDEDHPQRGRWQYDNANACAYRDDQAQCRIN